MPSSYETLQTYPPCSFDGCTRKTRILRFMLCQSHHQQLMRGEALRPLRQPNGSSWRLPNGYVRCSAPGHPNAKASGQILEHRLVMSGVLGRPLHADETVHHRNGVRHDNRPANLELRVDAHARGMCVDEAVEWAVELLRRHQPARLAEERSTTRKR